MYIFHLIFVKKKFAPKQTDLGMLSYTQTLRFSLRFRVCSLHLFTSLKVFKLSFSSLWFL
jgi:hypothetical protein